MQDKAILSTLGRWQADFQKSQAPSLSRGPQPYVSLGERGSFAPLATAFVKGDGQGGGAGIETRNSSAAERKVTKIVNDSRNKGPYQTIKGKKLTTLLNQMGATEHAVQQ